MYLEVLFEEGPRSAPGSAALLSLPTLFQPCRARTSALRPSRLQRLQIPIRDAAAGETAPVGVIRDVVRQMWSIGQTTITPDAPQALGIEQLIVGMGAVVTEHQAPQPQHGD